MRAVECIGPFKGPWDISEMDAAQYGEFQARMNSYFIKLPPEEESMRYQQLVALQIPMQWRKVSTSE